MSTKYIAHASVDENGKASGGSAGDQTRKEVCIRTWYSKPWNYLLKILNTKVRKVFGNNMIALAKNNNVGYDQSQRNTLLTQAEKVGFDFSKISVKCECDCSSSVVACLLGAIFKVLGKEEYEKAKKVLVVNGNCATTRTLRSALSKLLILVVLLKQTSVTFILKREVMLCVILMMETLLVLAQVLNQIISMQRPTKLLPTCT